MLNWYIQIQEEFLPLETQCALNFFLPFNSVVKSKNFVKNKNPLVPAVLSLLAIGSLILHIFKSIFCL